MLPFVSAIQVKSNDQVDFQARIKRSKSLAAVVSSYAVGGAWIWVGGANEAGRASRQGSRNQHESSSFIQVNQVIKAVFADQNILIAVTNGNTRPMVVTTPCRQTHCCNHAAHAQRVNNKIVIFMYTGLKEHGVGEAPGDSSQ